MNRLRKCVARVFTPKHTHTHMTFNKLRISERVASENPFDMSEHIESDFHIIYLNCSIHAFAVRLFFSRSHSLSIDTNAICVVGYSFYRPCMAYMWTTSYLLSAKILRFDHCFWTMYDNLLFIYLMQSSKFVA